MKAIHLFEKLKKLTPEQLEKLDLWVSLEFMDSQDGSDWEREQDGKVTGIDVTDCVVCLNAKS